MFILNKYTEGGEKDIQYTHTYTHNNEVSSHFLDA